MSLAQLPLSDTELLRRTASGDAAAFEELHTRFKSFVWSVVQRTTGGGPDINDVCQTAFMTIWRRAWTFDPARAKPATWIALTTRSIAIDALRARTRSRLWGELETWAADVTAREVSPMESDEMIRMAERVLEELPERQRVVVLAGLRGMNCRQIAGVERLPVSTVKTLKRRGVGRMRAAMALEAVG